VKNKEAYATGNACHEKNRPHPPPGFAIAVLPKKSQHCSEPKRVERSKRQNPNGDIIYSLEEKDEPEKLRKDNSGGNER
jgi:hypothetical protein